MGAFFRNSRHGTLTFILTYRGRCWQEGSRQPYDDPAVRRKAEALCAFIKTAMAAGTFEADYARIFPHGNRHDWLRPTPQRTPSVRQFAADFRAERQPPLYRRSYARALTVSLGRWIVPTIGHLPMDQVTQTHVVMIRERIFAAGRSVKYARNVLAHAQAMFTGAVKRHVIDANPCEGLDWPRQPPRQVRPLGSLDEVERILTHVRAKSVYAYRYILALAHTGMRPSEAAGLFWQDIELAGEGRIQIRRSRDQGRINATKTVASQRTLAPVSPILLTELRAMQPLRVQPEMPVFVGPTGQPINQARIYERHWMPALRALSIAPRRMYELRHTFISLALSGDPPANPQWIAEYTGTSLEMLRRTYGRYLRGADADPLAWLAVDKQQTYVPKGERHMAGRKKSKPANAFLRVSDGSRTHNPRSHSPVLYR